MQVVAGPSGSGKSSLFPVAAVGVDHFNVDDRCAQLNRGSYLDIKPSIRAQANAECEAFIARHIATRTSFAVEATLRTGITLRQGNAARANGFVLLMEFISAGSAEECVRRVTAGRGVTFRSRLPAWLRDLLRGSEFA
jgi:predicted ABC-type ATPase